MDVVGGASHSDVGMWATNRTLASRAIGAAHNPVVLCDPDELDQQWLLLALDYGMQTIIKWFYLLIDAIYESVLS